ncbi:MAG: signal peptidase I [Acidimicrobiia bacterium]|nr:signal peptidase I [Acidimicrobiia bacterium]
MIRKVASTNWFEAEARPAPPEADAPVPVAVAAVSTDAPIDTPLLETPPRRHRTAQLEFVAPSPPGEPPPPLAEPEVKQQRHRPARRSALWRRVASIALFAAIVGLWVVALRPTWMGGSASVLTVRGQSMEPTYLYGDIIIAHRRGSYRVGDIIAFRVPEGAIGAGTVVIHRIIGGDGTTGFVTQGDNNPDPDEWRPAPADILGSATWRIPMVGRLFSLMRTVPGIAAVTGVLAALLVVLGTDSPERRRRRRLEMGDGDADPAPVAEAPPPPAVPQGPADPLDGLIAPSLPAPVAPPIADSDHEVVGEYWGDLQYLAAILRERARSNSVFDDDLDEVAHPLV